jgi:hypothetical protein
MGRSVPGPLCVSRLGNEWVDKGTLCRTRTFAPGPIGLNSDVQHLSINADVPHRLLRGARAGLLYFPEVVRERISSALTLENMAFLCAAIAADIALSGTGVGVVFNVVLGAAVIVFVGTDAIHGCRQLASFYYLAKTARSDQDFAKAGAEFARGVTTLGIDAVIVLLTRRAGRTLRGEVEGADAETAAAGETKASARSKAGAVAETVEECRLRWKTYINDWNLRVPPNKGALWSKLFEPELDGIVKSKFSDADVAMRLAAQDGRLTLESKLPDDFWKKYRAEFPDVNGKPVRNDKTKGIWKMLSEKYAAGLEGLVIAYVDSDEVIISIDKGEPPLLTHEVKTIQDQIAKNHKITSIIFKDVWTFKSTKELTIRRGPVTFH